MYKYIYVFSFTNYFYKYLNIFLLNSYKEACLTALVSTSFHDAVVGARHAQLKERSNVLNNHTPVCSAGIAPSSAQP